MRTRLLISLFVGPWLLANSLPAAESPAEARDALVRAVTDSPALSAAARRAQAAQSRTESAGRLPDPEVEGMLSRMDGPMGARSTMYEMNVRQPLPRRGERAADRDRAAAAVAMAEADYALMAGEMAADTTMALAEADAAHARIRLLETQLERLQSVLRSVEVRMSAGSSVRLADRLTIETRVAAMQWMIEEERRMADDARAEARARLGLAPADTLPAFAAPLGTDISAADAAVLQVANARAGEASAMVKMAHASARPMTAVGLRLERERMAMGNEDTIGLAFMSEIPWRSRRYAAADARAAEADRAAAQAEGEAALHRIEAAITRVARAERLAASARRLSEDTLQRLDAEYDSLVQSAGVAGSGASAVFEIVDLLEKATDTELQLVQADLAVALSRAELWRYVPVSFFHSL